MEQSAFEAVMIGVNVFVFIIALSAGILLMSSVLDMVNYANERAIVGMNGTLAQSVGIVDERIYTGAQLLTFYRESIEAQNQESKNIFTVKLPGVNTSKDLATYIENESLVNYIDKKFELQYKGDSMGGKEYTFLLMNEES